MIRVEFYEGARQMTGTASAEVAARTFGEALTAVTRLYPDLEGRVVDGTRLTRHWRANLNAKRWIEDPDTPLADGDALVIVSALAGG